eukprot:TRINITY_DN5509_c1_g1_i6.p1 TRINITY_DN5509_c1_g1~~TRINITY_DN5509_c1_g1_i6.p1  ORF type:complete len:445 (-),score=58.87 TRINITY_DN5509_c1_g1_i6:48-1382(-)
MEHQQIQQMARRAQQQQQQQSSKKQVATCVAHTRAYADPSALTQHVLLLLRAYPSLVPNVATLDQQGENLVVVRGTLPIVFKSAKYNIPVSLWLLRGFPSTAPFCRVVPTPDMTIKTNNKHVDMQGTVYHPYLSNWNSRASLSTLCAQLVTVFSEDPPLRALTATPSQQGGTNNTAISNPVPPGAPVPYSQTGFMQHHIQQPYQQYPPQSYQHTQSFHQYPHHQVPHPQQHQLSQSYPYSHSQFQTIPILASPPGTDLLPYHGTSPSVSQNAIPPTHQGNVPASLGVPQRSASLQAVAVQVPLKPELAKQATARVRERTQQVYEEAQNICSELRGQAQTGAELAALTKQISLVQLRTEETAKWIADHEATAAASSDIDRISDPSDMRTSRAICLIAEEAAIDDTIYYLENALFKEGLVLDAFLKSIRDLSRQQFITRAHLRTFH